MESDSNSSLKSSPSTRPCKQKKKEAIFSIKASKWRDPDYQNRNKENPDQKSSKQAERKLFSRKTHLWGAKWRDWKINTSMGRSRSEFFSPNGIRSRDWGRREVTEAKRGMNRNGIVFNMRQLSLISVVMMLITIIRKAYVLKKSWSNPNSLPQLVSCYY